MLRFVANRVLQLIPTLLGVAVLTFLLMRMVPGDPTSMQGQSISEEVRAQMRAQWHLDESLPRQFWHYIKGLPLLDFGTSMRYEGVPVRRLLGEYFVRTLQLALAAFIVSVVAGLSLGVIAALRKGSWVDRAVMTVALAGISTPVFVVAALLVVVASAVGWHYISAAGMGAHLELCYLVLPAIALGSRPVAYLARMTRGSVLEVAQADFLQTARAKGLSERRVVTHHLLKNAMIPIVTVIGLNFADYLTGAILVETVFQWPGIGFLLRNAIAFRDLPVIMGSVVFTTFVFVAVNFAVDLAYGYLDPRIRFS